jgi:cytoskeletal protein CcmA (bactofilin family)
MMLNTKNRNRRAVDQVTELNGVIGTDSTFEGKLHGKGNYKVAGSVVGDCDLQGALMLDKSGSWSGNIIADIVVISGHVDGNVVARKQLEVSRTGHVQGRLTAPVIALENGAVHDGEMHMTQAHQFENKRG